MGGRGGVVVLRGGTFESRMSLAQVVALPALRSIYVLCVTMMKSSGRVSPLLDGTHEHEKRYLKKLAGILYVVYGG